MSLLRPISGMFWRGISTSVRLSNIKAVVSARQQAKMMNKFLAAAKKKERQLLTPPAVDSAAVSGADSGDAGDSVRIRPLRSTSSRHRHRLEALSAIYLDRITEVLSTGELLPGLLDSGVVISKVQLSGNMRLLYVFWTSPAGSDDWAVSARLEDASREVRAVLTQQRVTGHVPGIKFVRDSDNTCLLEVERRLALADFGPDFVPTDPTHYVKRQSVLGRPVTASHTEELLRDDTESPDAVTAEPPEMPQTAGGLNRAAILAEVEQRLQKAAAPHRHVQLHPEAVSPAAPVEPGSQQHEQQTFERFTRQRKWARLRQNKVNKTIDLHDWELLSRPRREEEDVEDPEDVSSPPPEDAQDFVRELPDRQ